MFGDRRVDDGRRRVRIPSVRVHQAAIGRKHDSVARPKLLTGRRLDRHAIGAKTAQLLVLAERLAQFAQRHIDGLAIDGSWPKQFAVLRDVDAPDDRRRVLRSGDTGEIGFHRRLTVWRSRRLHPLPQQAVHDLGRPLGNIARGTEYPRDATGRKVHRSVLCMANRRLEYPQHRLRFSAIDRPLLRLFAPPTLVPGRRQVNIYGSGVGMATQPVQTAQPLRKGAHAARFGDQEFGVDVGAHLQGLGGDHDEMTFAYRRRVTGGRHAMDGIENSLSGAFRFPFAGATGQEMHLRRSVRNRVAQAAECISCGSRSVGKHQAGNRAACLLDQRVCGSGEVLSGIARLDAHRHRLHGVEPLPNHRMSLVSGVEIETRSCGCVAGGSQGHYRRPRTGLAQDRFGSRCTLSQCRQQRHEVGSQVRFVHDDQTVGSGHGGVDRPHRPGGAVAAKQEPRSIHRQRRQHDRGPRRIGRAARRNASPKTDHFERCSRRICGQRAQAVCDFRDHLGRSTAQPGSRGIAECAADGRGVIGGRIDQQSPIDEPPDPCGCRALSRRAVSLGGEPPDGDVETGRLAKPCRHANFGRPLFRVVDPGSQTRLPWKRPAAIDRPIELGKGGHAWQPPTLRLLGHRHRQPVRKAPIRAVCRRRSLPARQPVPRTTA